MSDNASEVSIYPLIEEDYRNNIFYQLSHSNALVALTNSILLSGPANITFFHCMYIGTFTISEFQIKMFG